MGDGGVKVNKGMEPNPKDYEEEAIPFDDAMRTLLKAKPHPKNAAKPKRQKPKTKKA